MKPVYEKIGFKCGLELHIQLNTGKLFCKCDPKLIYGKDFKLKRKLTLTVGELGKIDKAAESEKIKNKTYIYEGKDTDSCLVEIDEEPPHKINEKALLTSISYANFLKMKFYDLIFVMRKTIIDGSNTTGFQRTALIARDGNLKTEQGNVKINYLNLEEDSCKKIKEDEKSTTFNLNRLGVPLIEVSTDENLKNPTHALEVATILGKSTRLNPNFVRGIGSIRQDVNVSIKGGARVELKGFQNLKQIPKIIDLEILRQLKLIKLSKNFKKTEFKAVDVTKLTMYGKGFFKNKNCFGVKLKGFKKFIGEELTPNKRIGTELSDYAKKFSEIKGLIHNQEIKKYEINEEKIFKKLGCGINDGFCLMIGDEKIVSKGLEFVVIRANQLSNGVPSEVRVVNEKTGSSSFLRQLSGSARMYPETDLEPFMITKSLIKKSLSYKVKDEEEVLKILTKTGLGLDLSKQLINTNKVEEFLKFNLSFEKIPSKNLARIITNPKNTLTKKELEKRLTLLNKEKKVDERLTKEFVEIYGPEGRYDKIFKKYGYDWNDIYGGEKYGTMDDRVKKLKIILEKIKQEEVKKFTKKQIEQITKTQAKKTKIFKQLMGLVMKETKGKADGKTVSDVVRKYSE